MGGRLLHPGDVGTSGASLGTIGEKSDPGRVSHQPVTVPGSSQRNLGQLPRCWLRHHGAIGKGEHGFTSGQHHIEGRAYQAHSRCRADGPECRPNHLASGIYRTGDTTVGFAQCHQGSAEVDRVGRDIQGVHAVADSIRPPLPEKLSNFSEPRILGRVQSVSSQHDRLDHFPGPKLFDCALHPGVLALTEDHPGLPAGSSVDQLASEAHERNRRANALATAGCTRGFTSPPNRATSRTRLELRYVRSTAGTRNTVSSEGWSWRFINAIWVSYSKSLTARRPRMIMVAPTRLANSANNPSKDSKTTRSSLPTAARSMSNRSSTEKSGCFIRFTATATISRSASPKLRRTRSSWPRVGGSKEPGYTAMRVMARNRR